MKNMLTIVTFYIMIYMRGRVLACAKLNFYRGFTSEYYICV